MNTKPTPKDAMDVAVEFVTEQSCGEWDDKTIREDALKLVKNVIEPEREYARQLEAQVAELRDALEGSAKFLDAIATEINEHGSCTRRSVHVFGKAAEARDILEKTK